jgi:hypothetical protein
MSVAGLSLYALAALYIVFCMCQTGTQRGFYVGSLACLALDAAFVALGSSIGTLSGLFPRVAYAAHLCALGLQFYILSNMMHHHLNIYARLLSSERYEPHGKRAEFMKGVITGAAGVYFLLLVLHLFVQPWRPLGTAFSNTFFFPTLIILVACMSAVLSLCFLSYVRTIHYILRTLGTTQRGNKRRLQGAAVLCLIVFTSKVISLIVFNVTDYYLSPLLISVLYHWTPMLVPLMSLAHVHRRNTAVMGRNRARAIEMTNIQWETGSIAVN